MLLNYNHFFSYSVHKVPKLNDFLFEIDKNDDDFENVHVINYYTIKFISLYCKSNICSLLFK